MNQKTQTFLPPDNHYIQSENYARFMEKLGWENVRLEGKIFVFIKKLPFGKSIIKIPRTLLPLPWAKIDKIAKEKNALFVKIEPNENESQIKLLKPEYKPDSPITPTKTILIDLTPIPEKMEASFKGDTRTCLRKAKREKLLAKESQDLEAFYKLFKKTAKERGFYHPFKKQMRFLWESFLPKAKIIFCFQKPLEKNPQPLAGCLLLFHQNVAYYKYAASTPEGRKKGASYLTLWRALINAKNNGCHTFDLEGISDPRYPKTKKYKGITHFKKSWGGQEFTYLGSFSKPHSTIFKLFSKMRLL